MVEQVIHTVDLARYLCGEVEEVFAYAANGFNKKLPNIITGYNIDDAVVMSLKFANGTVGNLMSCCAAQAGGPVFLNIWSSERSIRFTDWAHHVVIKTAGQTEEEAIKGDIDDIFPTEDRAFIDAVKTGDRSKIKCTHADGVKSTLLALAANESLVTGKPVSLK